MKCNWNSLGKLIPPNNSTVTNSKDNTPVPSTTKVLNLCDGSISTCLTSNKAKNSNARVGLTFMWGIQKRKSHSDNMLAGKVLKNLKMTNQATIPVLSKLMLLFVLLLIFNLHADLWHKWTIWIQRHVSSLQKLDTEDQIKASIEQKLQNL